MTTYDEVGASSRAQITSERSWRTQTGRHWPRSRDAMEAEVQRRRAAYLGLAYSEREVRDMALFRALDSSGKVSATTSRLLRDIAYVTNVDAASIASDCLRLSVEDEVPEADREAVHKQAEAIWDASQIDARRHWWARTMCSEGEILLEACLLYTSDAADE